MEADFVQRGSAVDVTVSRFRAELKAWLERARNGEEVVLTEHGVPIARVVGMKRESALERLTREGVISKPPRGPRPKLTLDDLVEASGPVSTYIREHRG